METILYIGNVELPDKTAAAHRVLNNAKILRLLGYRVVILGVEKEKSDASNLETNVPIQIQEGIEYFTISSPKTAYDMYRFYFTITDVKTLIQRYKSVKAVVFYDFGAMAMLRALYYCRRRRIGMISDCTEWYNPWRRKFPMNLIVGLDTFLRMKIVNKKLDGLILISRYLERYYNGVKNKILAPPLVDPLESKWSVDPLPYDSSKINLAYAGSMAGVKDRINYIIEAFTQIKDLSNTWIFRIVGMTSEQYLAVYPQHRDILQRFPNIVFYGRLLHSESIQILKSSDFLVFPRDQKRSTMAGFPTKFVESWTCGTPVITTNTSDLGEYITDGVNGFFLDMNAADWIEKFRKILTLSRNEIIRIKENVGKEKHLFDHRAFIQKFQDFFDSLNNKRP